MTSPPPTNHPLSDDGANDDRPTEVGSTLDSLSDADASLEQRLRAHPLSVDPVEDPGNWAGFGPPRLRRDRLMYECGYAAAISQSQVQLVRQTQANRRALRSWQFITASLLLFSVVLIGWPRPNASESSSVAANIEKSPSQVENRKVPSALVSQDGRSKSKKRDERRSHPTPMSYLSLQSNLARDVEDWPKPPMITGDTRFQGTLPIIRVSDYRRIMDEG